MYKDETVKYWLVICKEYDIINLYPHHNLYLACLHLYNYSTVFGELSKPDQSDIDNCAKSVLEKGFTSSKYYVMKNTISGMEFGVVYDIDCLKSAKNELQKEIYMTIISTQRDEKLKKLLN